MQKLKSTVGLMVALVFWLGEGWGQFPCELSGGGGAPASGGPTATQSGQFHDNSNYHLKFEVYEPCVLNSVRVFANGEDQRAIALLNPEGDILQAEVFSIPDGESVVELGWTLSPGSGYGLSCLAQNPQLWRDDLNATLNYPYAIGNYASITGSSINGENEFSYYYFFYDWNIGPAPATVNSGGYPCDHVELMDVEDLNALGGGANGNDCWGWVEPGTGREIAIFAKSNGTAFLDVTDATNIQYFGELPTASTSSLWRDVKVYNNHAFIVSEAGGHGMQVVDLLDVAALPTDAQSPVEAAMVYGQFGNAHNIVINEETGYAYAVGTNTFNGGLHVVNIQDPLNPQLVGSYDGAYTHDAQAVVYNGPDADYAGKEIVFCFNGYSGFAIVNAEDKSDIQLISNLTYDQLGYTHQGWLSENQRFAFLNDELDESNFGNNTRTYILDIADLDNPLVLGYFTSPTTAIDHNMYVVGSHLYQSNYLSGLRILNLDQSASGTLEEVGYFDTNPESDGAVFDGTWSNYPYFPSGNVAISTFTHFFMVRPDEEILNETNSVSSPVDAGQALGELLIQPNPAAEEIQLRFEGSGRVSGVVIWDAMGRIAKRWDALPIPSGAALNVDVSDVEPGVYVVTTSSGQSARLVIQR